ncbi:IS110 family transposase, partial [Micromonospora aurantiaca]|nr:IS110 family transposase [Micromonospora aurantiaca]
MQVRTLLDVLDAECINVDQLGQAVAEAFAQHPDYEIVTSFPGLGNELEARLPAETGDDRTWFADVRT